MRSLVFSTYGLHSNDDAHARTEVSIAGQTVGTEVAYNRPCRGVSVANQKMTG